MRPSWRTRFGLLASSVAVGAVIAPAHGQEARDQRHHSHPIEEIVITSDPLRRSGFLTTQGLSVLQGEGLDRELNATIGDTLDDLAGVSQSYFGPGASRPVIRGLGGDRLRVLINGVGTIDASTTSADHAVSVDLSNADRVEVIRGPATLIYGNNAIAGVVNVFDGRIPTELPDDGIDGDARVLFGSNADEVLFSGGSTLKVADGLAVHVDGFWRDTNNIEAPGDVRSDRLQAVLPLEEGEDEPRGEVTNSDQRNYGVNGGASWIGDWGFFGVSVGYLENDYGIAADLEAIEGALGGGDAEDEEEEEEGGEEGEEGVRIELDQIRVDVAGDLRLNWGWLEEARLRFGWADYEQAEIEGGVPEAIFLNDGWEARLEFQQARMGALSGAFGVQFRDRNFTGAEFIPSNDQFQAGLFAVESLTFGDLTLDAGLRVEIQDNETNDPGVQPAIERDFTTVSLSGAATYLLTQDYAVSLNVYRTERAPNPEELFSFGEHKAAFSFEIGDPDLDKEVATGFEASIKKRNGPVTGSANLFFTDYQDFIGFVFTGEVEEGLPVSTFINEDARFFGFEIEGVYEVWSQGDRAVDLDLVIDYTRAEFTDLDRPVPLIPPLTVQAGAEYFSAFADFRVDMEWADDQDRVFGGPFTFPTDSFFLLNTTLRLHPFEDRNVELVLQARNLTDDTVRYASSPLREFVPARGRDFRVGLRFGF